jgi:hypothetical protein
MKLNELRKAQDNYTESLRLINNLKKTSEKVRNDLIATIYLNMGAIASKEGLINDAIAYYELCVELK